MNTLEAAYDRLNRAAGATRRLWLLATEVLQAALNSRGDRLGTEGSASGNGTAWRMCLDLNRITLYARLDGTMGSVHARKVIHVADAVAGQGEGPLAAEPLALNFLIGSDSAPALDWVGALLLGYDPRRIPIVRHAFDSFEWPITDLESSNIQAHESAGPTLTEGDLEALTPAGVHVPPGWTAALRAQPVGRPAAA